jgi:anti-sigma-K factor RskA
MSATENMHEQVAAYALNALDADERRAFERHLEGCEECQRDLPAFADAAAALAFGAEPAAPSPELRGRILTEARRGGAVIPFPNRRIVPIVATIAAVAACAAIGLGIWAATLNHSLSHERNARASDDAALAVLADPTAKRVPLNGRRGVLAVRGDGSAALAVDGLGRAPSGKTYEAWVIKGKTPAPAGLFHGESARATLVALRLRVGSGSIVAVTVERSGGVSLPTTKPILSAAV